MGQEIELKLSIGEADARRLFRHPFIRRHAQGPTVNKHLTNQYFDTPDQVLRQNAMAFRIRFDGERYVQTLKKKGTSRDGLTVRGEWEWVLKGPQIDTACVPAEIWPLKRCPERLMPVFRTDFQRTRLLLEFLYETGLHSQSPVRVEMALDRGIVATEKDHGPMVEAKILEVEFELLDGEPQALMKISRQLQRDIRLSPCDISKAERGYRLLAGT